MQYKYIVDTKLWAYYLIQRGRPLSDIVNKIAELIYKLEKKGEIYLCFDIGHSDFREAEQSYYKGHRRNALAKKSPAEQAAHKLFNENYAKLPYLFRGLGVHVAAVPGVEADDLASLIVESYKDQPDTKITVITNDFDWFHMVVDSDTVRFYNGEDLYYKKDVQAKYSMTTRREFSVLKSITGDKSDNIKFVKFLAEVKGTELFKRIYELYDNDPTDEHIIDELEGYVENSKRLVVHPFHVEDGRKTVREAFLSNMKIADPFTDMEHLTKKQRTQVEDILAAEAPITLDADSIYNKCVDLFGYPVELSAIAKRIYGVKN